MPMVPQAAVAMLACARVGAVHSVVFGGFSAAALRDRILDAEAVAVITADGGNRRGSVLPLKPAVDEALESCESVKTVFVVKRTDTDVMLKEGRDIWYHEAVAEASDECPAEPMDAEDPLFILYTSGSTGKPKGVLHTTGGYMVYTYLTTKYVFDLRDDDVFWCTADVGWITGHSYIVYGPMLNGATQVMYEGAPTYPGPGPPLGPCQQIQGDGLLHRPHRDPRLYEARRRAPPEARFILLTLTRHRWRAHQPRRLGCGTAASLAGTAALL